MVVPWIGFPLSRLLDMVPPSPDAQYVRFESYAVRQTASAYSTYQWPYVEALTLAEARNELAFVAVGIFQQPLPPQVGTLRKIRSEYKVSRLFTQNLKPARSIWYLRSSARGAQRARGRGSGGSRCRRRWGVLKAKEARTRPEREFRSWKCIVHFLYWVEYVYPMHLRVTVSCKKLPALKMRNTW